MGLTCTSWRASSGRGAGGTSSMLPSSWPNRACAPRRSGSPAEPYRTSESCFEIGKGREARICLMPTNASGP
eukprot:4117219-Alexandrium_andersonii.AAC.1